MINERNASYQYIGNFANGIADEAAFEAMAAGSIAVVRALDNLSEESSIIAQPTVPVRIVQKKADGTYVFSPIFTAAQILTKTKLAYVADVQQVSYFGYDGTVNTTGFGAITVGNTYTLHMVLEHTRNAYNNAPQIKTIPFKAQTTSQGDLAKGLTEQFLKTFSTLREPFPVILVERVGDGTYTNSTGWTLTTGSRVITKTAHGLTPISGTSLRIGVADSSAIVNAPLYNVASYSVNTITLDTPYQGVPSVAGHVAYATVAPTVFGLKFTGLAQPFDAINDSMVNQLVNFKITSEDFSGLSEYKAIGAKYGSGTYNQIAYEETYSQFLDKSPVISRRPRTRYRQEAVYGNTYDIINLVIQASDIHFEAVGINTKSLINITLATKNGLAYDALDTIFAV